MPVTSAGVGLDRPGLGLDTGPLEPEQRGVLLRVGEPLHPGMYVRAKGPARERKGEG